jgi:hypothetical protein
VNNCEIKVEDTLASGNKVSLTKNQKGELIINYLSNEKEILNQIKFERIYDLENFLHASLMLFGKFEEKLYRDEQ